MQTMESIGCFSLESSQLPCLADRRLSLIPFFIVLVLSATVLVLIIESRKLGVSAKPLCFSALMLWERRD